MAELLVLARGPKERLDTSPRKGHVVAARPDGWCWGKEECLPRFVILKVSGKPEDFAEYLQPETKAVVDGAGKPHQILSAYRQVSVDGKTVDSCVAEKGVGLISKSDLDSAKVGSKG